MISCCLLWSTNVLYSPIASNSVKDMHQICCLSTIIRQHFLLQFLTVFYVCHALCVCLSVCPLKTRGCVERLSPNFQSNSAAFRGWFPRRSGDGFRGVQGMVSAASRRWFPRRPGDGFRGVQEMVSAASRRWFPRRPGDGFRGVQGMVFDTKYWGGVVVVTGP